MLKHTLTTLSLLMLIPASSAASRHYVLDFATLNPPLISSTMKDSRNPSDHFQASGKLELNDDTHIANRTLKLCFNNVCSEKLERYRIVGYTPGTGAVLLREVNTGNEHSMVFIWNYFNLGLIETLPSTWDTLANQKLLVSWKDNNGGLPPEENALSYDKVVNSAMDAILTQQLNMKIHKGNTPPLINGNFSINPQMVKKSTFTDSWEGKNVATSTFNFINQNNKKLSIDIKNTTNYLASFGKGIESFSAPNAYIGGSDNYFTIAFTTNGEIRHGFQVSRYTNLVVISGEVDKDTTSKVIGIRQFQYATIMLDDNGDRFNQLIPVGQARLYVDDYANLQ